MTEATNNPNIPSPETPTNLEDALMEFAGTFVDGPDFHEAIQRSLDAHERLFAAKNGGIPLTPTEELEFARLNDFFTSASRLIEDYHNRTADPSN